MIIPETLPLKHCSRYLPLKTDHLRASYLDLPGSAEINLAALDNHPGLLVLSLKHDSMNFKKGGSKG